MAERSTKRKSRTTRKSRSAGRTAATPPPEQPAGEAQPANGAADAAPAGTKVRIRFYCQGIGDCHLLKFAKEGGGDFWMMIDCGVHKSITGGPATIDKIVDDIASLTNKRLDVIVLTHEHWDHNSGFLTAEKKFAQFSVGEVWAAWTENPDDKQARDFDKFKTSAADALQQASQHLQGLDGLAPHLAVVKEGLDAVMGFYDVTSLKGMKGPKGRTLRSARDTAVALAQPSHRRYLEPTTTAPITLPGMATPMRIYVLGPPRDPAMLGLTVRQSEMYGLAGNAGWPAAMAIGNAFAALKGQLDPNLDPATPFNPDEGMDLKEARNVKRRASAEARERHTSDFLRNHYDGPAQLPPTHAHRDAAPDPDETDQSWRRIDHDWLGVSADLAIQLDDRTNNSSLVLAFEFLDSKEVLLFVGDAQVGNWLSWQNVSWKIDDATVTAPELLARTVFYKVGHHGSENATLKQHGLELMTNPNLAAFIPTNAKDAVKVKWGAMPFDPILKDLEKRTSTRVVRADDKWLAQAAGNPDFQVPSGAIKALRHDPSGLGLWVEMDIG
jgi:Metallo-beta-lactamase superfamily